MIQPRRFAFTLIELLVIMAIIAILAALIFPATRAVVATRTKHRARAELKEVESSIDIYKAELNFYPPSSTDGSSANPLYYELSGTRLNNGVYVTLDGNASLPASDVFIAFGVDGFANCSKGTSTDDEQPKVKSYTKGALRQGQFLQAAITNLALHASTRAVVLGTQLQGVSMLAGAITPYGYNSATPTNNPNSYDLWLDILVGGAPVRVCNWNSKPIKL
jgi:type II secretory pathway pseudopilin PulG